MIRLLAVTLGALVIILPARALDRIEFSAAIYKGCLADSVGNDQRRKDLATLRVSAPQICACVAEISSTLVDAGELAVLEKTGQFPDRLNRLPVYRHCAETLSQ